MNPNAFEMQNGFWMTYGQQLQPIDKPDEMPNHRVSISWSKTAPIKRLFNDDDLEFYKTTLKLRHSRETATGRAVFLGQGGSYEYETLEYFNMNFRYGQQRHELLVFNYLGNKVKQIWHVAREFTISLITIFIGLKIVICLMHVFLSIDMLRGVSNPVVALQPNNTRGAIGYLQYLTQRSSEQNLTRKSTTVELSDDDTNLVIVRAKNAKSIPEKSQN